MYLDQKRDRVLLRDGRSIVTPQHFARETLRGRNTDHLFVVDTYDSQVYDLHYHRKTSSDIDEIEIDPESHIHTDEDMDELLHRITESPRLTHGEPGIIRVEKELAYFEKTNNITFLLKCSDLIQQFKEDKVVFGVGRGSACASFILYLLEVHDIDPVKYDIDFNELAKEIE